MAELQAQTVEELDFNSPDVIGEPEPSSADTVGATGRGRGRGRGSGSGSGRSRGEPYVPAAPTARERLTEDQLSARMEAMKLQNAQLQARREAAIADENQYSTIEEQAKQEQAAARKEQEALKARTAEIQQAINAEREASAARKLKKVEGREWDREKAEEDWNPAASTLADLPSGRDYGPISQVHRDGERNWDRRARGRGRGRDRGGRGGISVSRTHDVSSSDGREKRVSAPTNADISDPQQFPSLNADAKSFRPTSTNQPGAKQDSQSTPIAAATDQSND